MGRRSLGCILVMGSEGDMVSYNLAGFCTVSACKDNTEMDDPESIGTRHSGIYLYDFHIFRSELDFEITPYSEFAHFLEEQI